jgi:hypothetical protein
MGSTMCCILLADQYPWVLIDTFHSPRMIDSEGSRR